jgi:hypothetical protein
MIIRRLTLLSSLSYNMQSRVLAALHGCLRPLARVLLACGIGYKEFAQLAKLAFVSEAIERQRANGAVLNISRISVSTGLSRKELARLRDEIELMSANAKVTPYPSGHESCGSRVMQLWHVDTKYLDELGSPLALPMDGSPASFASLVRRVAGDIPVGAVKSELLAANAIEELADGRIIATKRHFIPSDTGEEIILGLTKFLYPVLVGLERNTQAKELFPYFQRIAYSHRLGTDGMQRFRKIARSRAVEFIDAIDDWISVTEAPPESSVDGGENTMSAVGVFYFEGQIPDAHASWDERSNQTGGESK